MVADILRNRLKLTEGQNGVVKYEEEKKHCPDFMTRDSTLTVLMQTSSHIKAIYHIFVVILLMLLFDTVIYDFVETGKINIGLSAIIYGFGDIKRGAILWLYEFSIALLFYICLRSYGAASKLLRNKAAASRALSMLGIAGLVILQVALVAVPIRELKRKHVISIGSSFTVTCEMFRFAMKIHAVAVACRPRCHKDGVPLPTFKQYLYFLFAPTLIYRDEYPRTTKTRWGVVIFHFTEVAAIIFYYSFLYERFLLPFWSDYGKQETVELGSIVRRIFASIFPGIISLLCIFYCILHAWFNAFAEMLKFGDRLFYEDWWTSSQFSRYYRTWNMVVHSWLRDHIYRPLAPRTGRVFSTLMVFLVSAIAHEVIIALAFGFFYPVLLIEFAVIGIIMLPLTFTTGRQYPNVFNLIMWLSFFSGTGILWSLYPMEFYARKNCPPSENDSFFIPKSWSCPEIILKPNWTFKNPFYQN